jgi:glucose-6-phosphate 1-dehydrogenase
MWLTQKLLDETSERNIRAIESIVDLQHYLKGNPPTYMSDRDLNLFLERCFYLGIEYKTEPMVEMIQYEIKRRESKRQDKINRRLYLVTAAAAIATCVQALMMLIKDDAKTIVVSQPFVVNGASWAPVRTKVPMCLPADL